ncbi:MAG: hypothetical protein ABJE79_14185, partial [Marinomonas sp.]
MATPIFIENYEFQGFGGVSSKCSLSIYFPTKIEQSALVVCTQKEGAAGTSITNGFELILDKLCREGVRGKHGDDLKEILSKNSSSVEGIFKKLTSYFTNKDIEDLNFYELFKKEVIVWLEVYPECVGIVNDRVTVQRVYVTKDGSPVWSNFLEKEYID